jgi:hypothetical protein
VTGPAVTCSRRAVGAIITDRPGRYLLFTRATYPAGYAPVEDHVDGRGFAAAIHAAVRRQTGLAVTGLAPAWTGWRGNTCDRQPGPAGTGHEWQVCRAEVDGTFRPGDPAIQAVRMVTGPQLQQLANRTALYARGRIPAGQFAGRPGLEAVWVRFFYDIGLVVMTGGDLALTDQLASIPAPGATR